MAVADRTMTSGRDYTIASAPRSPHVHLIRTATGGHVFVANGSRLFDADADLFKRFEAALTNGSVRELLDRAGVSGTPFIDDSPLTAPPLHALSLAIAQRCNLGCSYCYAQQGDFGGAAKSMTRDVADRSVDLLVAAATPGVHRFGDR